MPPRMTANPVRPARYRPGKGPEEGSDSQSEAESEQEQESQAPQKRISRAPAQRIIPSSTKAFKDISLQNTAGSKPPLAQPAINEDDFETESEGSDSGSASGSDEKSEEASSSEVESSSEDEAPRKLLRPTFIRKDKRQVPAEVAEADLDASAAANQEARRVQRANELVQEQLERNAAARAAGKKYWDDDEEGVGEEVDDTDGIDPEAEYAAWKLRELKRLKRDRDAIEEAEKEREEVERRRNLTQEERDAEDHEYLEKQKAERDDRGQTGFMQKYFHKGAFFQDDSKALGLDRRDVMGSRFVDDTNREILPEYMQIRDMTKLGKKGRSKYKDLRAEDTGSWGTYDRKGPRGDRGLDERFQPDRRGGDRDGPSGANATAVRERRKNSPSRNEIRKRSRSPPPETYDNEKRRKVEI